jgi:uncharacterized membrane protein (UPF0127 family)
MVRLLILIAAGLFLTACGQRPTELRDISATEVTFPNGKKFLCETMLRDIDLTRGMMFQDSLAPDRGMILIHPAETTHRAFTYNVRIPLDIIWLDKNLRVVEISANVPPCKSKSAKECPIYGGQQKSRYILELNAGTAAANGLQIGDRLDF